MDSLRLESDYRFGVVPLEGQATGLVTDEKGHIVTNNNVIDDAATVQVTLKDGRAFIGEVVGTDPATDIALIRVDANDRREIREMKDLPLALSKLRIGEVFKLSLLRDGKRYETSLRSKEAPSQVLPGRRR